MGNSSLDKLTVIEGEIVKFYTNQSFHDFPKDRGFEGCDVKIKNDDEEVWVKYLITPDSLTDALLKKGNAKIYLIKENANYGGFVLAIKRDGKLREDIEAALKARELAIHISQMTCREFKKEYKPKFSGTGVRARIGLYQSLFYGEDLSVSFFTTLKIMLVVILAAFMFYGFTDTMWAAPKSVRFIIFLFIMIPIIEFLLHRDDIRDVKRAKKMIGKIPSETIIRKWLKGV